MGFLLLFDLTNEQSFLSIRSWLEQLKVILIIFLLYQVYVLLNFLGSIALENLSLNNTTCVIVIT